METVGKSSELTVFADGDVEQLEASFRSFLGSVLSACAPLGVQCHHLDDTPRRFVGYLREVLAGYETDDHYVQDMISRSSFPENKVKRRPVMVGPVETWAACPHHLLPARLRTWVGYVCRTHLLGISKIPRLVEIFSKRLLLQEQVAIAVQEALMSNEVLQPQAVYVKIVGVHTCCCSRGAKSMAPVTSLSMTGDLMTDAELRFFQDFSSGTVTL